VTSIQDIQRAIGGLSAAERQTLLDWMLEADRRGAEACGD